MTTPLLPFTLSPLPGESFDSWFEAYAARLQVSTGDLADALGLPGEYLRTTIGSLLTGGVKPAHLQRISIATGLPTTSLHELFHRPGPTPTAGKPVVARAMRMAWAPAAGTKFCPSCLADNGGRFNLAWRLPWTFFCLHHNEMLAPACPQCHKPPRARLISVARRPEPTRCCSPKPGRTRRTWTPCGADLTSAVVVSPIDDGDAHRAQLFISDKLAHAGAGPDSAHGREAIEALTDLTVIAHNLANPGRIGTRRVRPTMLNASTLTTAVRLLSNEHVDELAALARRQAHPSRRTSAVPESWRPASAALTARIAHCRDADLSATERIRYATTLPALSLSQRPAVDPAIARASLIPDQIWSGWAVRLTNDDSHDPARLRPAAAVALLLPHSDLKLPKAAALLSEHVKGDAVEHQLTTLANTPNGAATLRILTQLSLALDQHGSPIDYARRRRLAAGTELIDASTWTQLSHRNHYFKGSRRRLRFARCYLYELLTGGSLTIAPHPYNLPSPLRAEYHEFVLGLPAAVVHDLHSHARRLLDGSGIADEPLQWQPPKEWVAVDVWPGADPDLTDPAPLHRELRNGDPASRVAGRHGLSMEHLRHIIRHNPLPGQDQPHHRPGAIQPDEDSTHPYRRVGDVYHVNVVWLHEQYVTWRRSLADIAADIGCHSTTLGEFAKQPGIPLRPRGGGSDFIAPNAAPAHPATLPSPLREALTGQDARSRIDRFLLIAEHGTIRKAAAELGRSDTTLNKQLANLESRCGGPLFDRPPRRLGNLTQLGKQLRQQARRYLLPPEPKVVPV